MAQTTFDDQQSGTTSRRRPLEWSSSGSITDRAFVLSLGGLAVLVLAVVALIGWELWSGSSLSRSANGLDFIRTEKWDPAKDIYGAKAYIFGTLYTSAVAVLLATPLGVGTAICLNELAPRSFRTIIGFLVEMLAAIPSVIYGLWSLFVLVPFIRTTLQPTLKAHFGSLAIFEGPPYGVGYLAASLVLTIMILPTITAVSQAVITAAPRAPRDGAYALGATRWEVIRAVTLPASRSGIIGAVILGLGRALGETMAVTMVIGNRGNISFSLFSLGDTMASVIANQFAEASTNLYESALVQVAFILFLMTIVINLCARLLVTRLSGPTGAQR